MYLLFDIGGTKMRMAVSSDAKTLENIQTIKTPPTFDEGKDFLKKYIGSLGAKDKIDGVSGGLPGTLNKVRSVFLSGKNLQGWTNAPVKQGLEEIFNAPVYLSNDADVAGLGEALFGAGKGYSIVAFLTVGTGVGGVRIVNGKTDESSMGFEPGYQIIDIDGSVESKYLLPDERYSNTAGYLQRLVSGKDVSSRIKKPIENINDAEVWEKMTQYLAVGINNTLCFWSPDIVVLGGGVALSSKLSLPAIKERLLYYWARSSNIPPIVKASLGDNSGLCGALAYISGL